jgi:hypothetical protein
LLSGLNPRRIDRKPWCPNYRAKRSPLLQATDKITKSSRAWLNPLSQFCTPWAAVYNVRPELMVGFQGSPLIVVSRDHR